MVVTNVFAITERSLYMVLFYLPFLLIPFIYSNYREIGFKELSLKHAIMDVVYFILGLVLIISLLNIVVTFVHTSKVIKDDTDRVSQVIKKFDIGDIVVMCYLAGIVEEIFFRGFLQNRIGLIPSTIIFTYFHLGYGSQLELIGVFLISLILGIIYEISGKRIYPVIMIHFTFDLLSSLSTIS